MNHVKRAVPFVSLILLAGLWACTKGGQKIGSVNGRTITEQEFQSFLKIKHIPAEDASAVEQAKRSYLERSALEAAILKTKTLNDSDIDMEVNEFRRQLVINKYFDTLLDKLVDDKAIQNHYNTHQQEYQSRQMHVAHILVRTRPRMTDSEVKAALTKAQDIYGKLKQGSTFKALAEKFSEDAMSAKNAGDLGWIQDGAISPEFTQAVLALKPEEFSQPIRTPFGFHIAKLIEAPKVVTRSYEEVKGDIRYQLRQKTKDAELKKLMSTVSIDGLSLR